VRDLRRGRVGGAGGEPRGVAREETALDLLDACARDGDAFQLHINDLVDAFRRATPEGRAAMVAAGLPASGRFEGLVAAVVSAL